MSTAVRRIVFVLAVIAASPTALLAQNPSVEDVMKYRPSQRDVVYETPKAEEFKQCKLSVVKVGDGSAWVLVGPVGQTLRRFVDTDGDRTVDEYRYFNLGLEVFRDIDSNGNGKPDQCRWVNSGGTRWGLDENEDRRIDRWRFISAEEAAHVAVNAMIRKDEQALSSVLVNSDDLRALGIKADLGRKMLEAVASPGRKMSDVLAKSKSLNSKSRWMRFDAQSPGLIPSDDGKAARDLMVYENAMAIIENGNETALLQIGEMIQVGSVWKLTRVPMPLEGTGVQVTAGGLLMQPAIAALDSPPGAENVSPEMRKLIEQLQELDTNSPGPTASRTVMARYNAARADVVRKLISAAKSPSDREMYTRQLADGLAAAVQSGGFPDGFKQLQKLEADFARSGKKSPLLGYISYRRLLAEYFMRLQSNDNEQREAAQKWWHEQLETYARAWPEADDTGDALLQLAQSLELAGKAEESRKWYTQLTRSHSDSSPGQRAAGAMRRMALGGKPLALSGKDLNGRDINIAAYRGKVVLIPFWATWCELCTQDLPQVRALYTQYRSRGFEILGVNLDSVPGAIPDFVKTNRMTWNSIQDGGGFEGPVARQYGLISLPTMFLVDKSGRVVSRNISVEELKTTLPELLKK